MQQPFLTHCRFVRQTGGMCMFALVVVAWHPYHTTLVENGTDSRHLPPEFFSAVRDGITEELAEQPVRAVLVDGVFHEVDSNYQSFRTAAKHATRLALGRLPLSLPPDERSAEEITEAWRVDRESRSAALVEHLTGELAHFGFALENEVWWRAKAETEQLLRLLPNAPRVPTEIDLGLALACPALLEFLKVEDWRESSGQVPQELATKKLSHLIEETYELNDEIGRRMTAAIAEWGLLYLDSYPDRSSLLEAPGYMDGGTRAALLYLVGRQEEAAETAKAALENGFGNRKQRRFSNLVLEKLGVEIDSAGSEQNSNEERQTDHHR